MFLVQTFYELRDVRQVIYKFRYKFNIVNTRLLPSKNQVFKIIKKFETKGAVITLPRKKFDTGYHSGAIDSKVADIKELFRRESATSIRKSSRALGIPRETVRRHLKKSLKLKPYKIQFLHHLKDGDHQKILNFADSFTKVR